MGRRARITRPQVLAAAREAFAERGFDGTTLASIAARLEVSPAALLRHAPTKEALFGAAMASARSSVGVPLEFLDTLDGSEDPIPVLRRIAERVIPILEATFAESIVGWLHARRGPGPVAIPLPFDPRSRSTPPQQVFSAIEGYLARAVARGTLSIADPRAAATAFQGALFAYVSFQKLFRILDPPLPLDRYLETLLAIWTRGALPRRPAPKKGKRKTR
ncbi:MAG TPA: TetR/AcrR family transcriptional regulator [Thermoanaerobaculia bacterium]|nr:TetR/AcrR family transcriptional regulator [Thermoanaerobaculia bacterium]